jgi:hypothetical protein
VLESPDLLERAEISYRKQLGLVGAVGIEPTTCLPRLLIQTSV